MKEELTQRKSEKAQSPTEELIFRTNLNTEKREGKPKTVRTVGFLVAGKGLV